MKVKITLEYDGINFHGWQTQHQLRTVQGELNFALFVYFKALLKKNNLSEDCLIKKNYTVSGSGRTDAGVSARCQVASFFWLEKLDFNKDSFLKSLNGITSADMTVVDAEIVSDNFDARGSAKSKIYTYRISNNKYPPAIDRNKVLHVPYSLDLDLMKEGAELLKGTHDFNLFRASDCSAKTTVRTISDSFFTVEDYNIIKFTIKGNGFLKNMVRIIVGELLNLGSGKSNLELLDKRLKAVTADYKKIKTAPPEPLTLEKVNY